MIGPTPIDLITLDQAVEWIFGAAQSPNQNVNVLQSLISSLSLDFLRRTGRATQNGSVPSASPFNQAIDYTESYTGNGNDKIMLRNWPIVSVSSVKIFGNPIAQSTGTTVPGWFVDGTGKFLCLRGFSGGIGGAVWSGLRGSVVRSGWPKQTDCIEVSYSAGFQARNVTDELHTIQDVPPKWVAGGAYGSGAVTFDGTYMQQASIVAGDQDVANAGTVTPAWGKDLGVVAADGSYLAWTNIGRPFIIKVYQLPWVSDVGVKYFDTGIPLAKVSVAPQVGQYYPLGNGAYLFSWADACRQVLISYLAAGTPADIQETILRWVNLIYKRRGWEGIRSLMQKDVGSTIYTSFEVDPSFEKVFAYYRRRA